MIDEALTARVDGWGPDFTEITANCPRVGCGWTRDWDTGHPAEVTLAMIADAVREHLKRGHLDVQQPQRQHAPSPEDQCCRHAA